MSWARPEGNAKDSKNMQSVSIPKAPKYLESKDKNTGNFVIEDCYPGYGTTLGNSIRRVLLSSLGGSAVTSAKIKGVTHEFTTLKGVLEDMVQVILNLKQVRFKLHSVDSATVMLRVKGEKKVLAKDIKTTSEVEVVNPQQHIATLTGSNSELEIELKIERGLGYVPVEQQEREEKEIGSIAIDAVFTPIRRVNFVVDNMRVGKRTDYDKITLEITTDGTITPEQAYEQAVEILMEQFNAIAKIGVESEETEKEESKETSEEVAVAEEQFVPEKEETEVSSLKLSTRTLNVLDANNISTIDQIAKMNEEELGELDGMGEKGIKEIKKAIGSLGITLKSE